MKGVTMEENKEQLAALKRLLDLPHNKQCADCVGGGGAARASWASINTGVFICMRCAGIHRGLGVHVSKVCQESNGHIVFSICYLDNCTAKPVLNFDHLPLHASSQATEVVCICLTNNMLA